MQIITQYTLESIKGYISYALSNTYNVFAQAYYQSMPYLLEAVNIIMVNQFTIACCLFAISTSYYVYTRWNQPTYAKPGADTNLEVGNKGGQKNPCEYAEQNIPSEEEFVSGLMQEGMQQNKPTYAQLEYMFHGEDISSILDENPRWDDLLPSDPATTLKYVELHLNDLYYANNATEYSEERYKVELSSEFIEIKPQYISDVSKPLMSIVNLFRDEQIYDISGDGQYIAAYNNIQTLWQVSEQSPEHVDQYQKRAVEELIDHDSLEPDQKSQISEDTATILDQRRHILTNYGIKTDYKNVQFKLLKGIKEATIQISNKILAFNNALSGKAILSSGHPGKECWLTLKTHVEALKTHLSSVLVECIKGGYEYTYKFHLQTLIPVTAEHAHNLSNHDIPPHELSTLFDQLQNTDENPRMEFDSPMQTIDQWKHPLIGLFDQTLEICESKIDQPDHSASPSLSKEDLDRLESSFVVNNIREEDNTSTATSER